MSITPCGVHNEAAFVGSNSFGKGFWTFLDNDVPPSSLTWFGDVESFALRGLELRHDDLTLKLGFANLSFNLTSIHSKISEVSKQFLGAILTANERKQLWAVDRLATAHLSQSRLTCVSSINVVQQVPSIKVGWVSRDVRNGIFVFTPRMRNSTNARIIFLRAISYVEP